MNNLTRREWMTALAGGNMALSAPGSGQTRRPPNVLLIMSDDQGYGDLSLHGNPHLKTPNLDKLARQGVEFTRFYVSPVCAPTRASLLTGRYNVRCGVYGVTYGRETMHTGETTIAEALRGAGYRTALFGKWHLGEHYPYVPHGQGFDEFVGFRTGHWMNYFDSELERLEAGKRVNTIAAHIDVFPTLPDLCGVVQPKGLPIDGCSLRPLLFCERQNRPERMIFTHRESLEDPASMYPGAVRTQRFNLVNGEELCDMIVDPVEQNNIASKHPQKVAELRSAYEAWYREAPGERGFQRRPIPAGYAEETPVILPAPQSYFHGALRFHGGVGYAHDWITGWNHLEDSVYWDIDVVRAGQYEVTLSYLCPRADVGAKIAVSAAGQSLQATITRPSPMTRKPSKSVIPENVYPEMHWARLRLGRFPLKAGRSTLTVKALSKPGAAVMDRKEVSLRWLDE